MLVAAFFFFRWAVIPLMYTTLSSFKSGSSAYLTLFCGNMLVGLLTSIAIFVFGLLDTSSVSAFYSVKDVL